MTLIKSISGIRGTIGPNVGEDLTPIDIVKFTAAYSTLRRQDVKEGKMLRIVVGRDARMSGQMVQNLVVGTLISCGVEVINIGLATTPTTELAVIFENADGGIIITASHNPKQWNALKLLNNKGEFLSDEQGRKVIELAESSNFDFMQVDNLGTVINKDYTQQHIDAVLAYPLTDVKAIREANFKVVLDPINSVGAIVMPKLLEALGVECITINGNPDGRFAHNPEPLPSNLIGLSRAVIENNADLGISVDPDVDRLAFYCEDGEPFGEEYTLVSVADYVLSKKKGIAVSNLSSSRALADVAAQHNCEYLASAVGEVNVTTAMRASGAVIGGEGNGGVIVPDFHYGRDALIGTALFLSNLAHKKLKVSELRHSYPEYSVSKNKIQIDDPKKVEPILEAIKKKYASERITTIDGVRIDFDEDRKWIILRKSNTEPIIRIYAEAPTIEQADSLASEFIEFARGI